MEYLTATAAVSATSNATIRHRHRRQRRAGLSSQHRPLGVAVEHRRLDRATANGSAKSVTLTVNP
jgi:hypothetical protein